MHYYIREFGAFAIPREHPYSIAFADEETRKIREVYNYVWTDEIT